MAFADQDKSVEKAWCRLAWRSVAILPKSLGS